MKTKYIIFDIGWTLYNGNVISEKSLTYIYKKYFSNLELDFQKFLDSYKEICSQYFIDHWDIAYGEEQHFYYLVKKYSDKLEHQIVLKEYRSYFNSLLQPIDGVFDVFQKLACMGYKIWILSNGRHKNQRDKLKIFGLDKYIDILLISEDIDIMKPDLSIFKDLIQKTQTSGRNILMIGDSYKQDILPAKKLWMQTILYSDKPVSGTLIFHTHSQLIWIINQIEWK